MWLKNFFRFRKRASQLTKADLANAEAWSIQPDDASGIARLIVALADETDEMRQKAAESLVAVGAPVVQPLIARSNECYHGDRAAAYAAWAFGQIGDHRAVKPLLRFLDCGDEQTQATAALALGRLCDVRAVEPLYEHLRTRASFSPATARAACDALVMIGRPAADLPIADLARHGRHWASRELAAWPLGRIGDLRALEPMLRATSPIAGDRLLLQSMADFGSPAVEPLIGFLRDHDDEVRETAAAVLEMIGDERAIAPLDAAIHDHSERVREQANIALAAIRDRSRP